MVEDAVFSDDHAEFLIPSVYVALEPVTRSIAEEILAGSADITAGDFVLAATTWVQEHIAYQVGTTNVHSTVLDVLEGGSGVCQDFSHLLISLCRHAGTAGSLCQWLPRRCRRAARLRTPGSRRSFRRTAG